MTNFSCIPMANRETNKEMTKLFKYYASEWITCHTPIFAAGSENGRLKILHIFKASEYISVMLLSTAKTAAKG